MECRPMTRAYGTVHRSGPGVGCFGAGPDEPTDSRTKVGTPLGPETRRDWGNTRERPGIYLAPVEFVILNRMESLLAESFSVNAAQNPLCSSWIRRQQLGPDESTDNANSAIRWRVVKRPDQRP